MITTILKILVIFIIAYLLKWMYDRRVHKEEVEYEKKKETYEFGFLTKDLLSELEDTEFKSVKERIENIRTGNIRINLIRREMKIIAVALYSWPSGLWEFRKNNNEDSFSKYSHLFFIDVIPEYYDFGYFSKIMESIIFETYRISEGITIHLDPKENINKLLEEDFGFKDVNNNKLKVLKFDEFDVI